MWRVFKPLPGTQGESSAFHKSDIRGAITARWRPVIIEIGVHEGGHTRLLLNACLLRLGTVIGIDPHPATAISRVMRLHPLARLLSVTSLDGLPVLIEQKVKADVAIVDGDHNYYTVLNELLLLEKLVSPTGVIFLHDVSWPYARRDLYYAPDRIPASARHPYERAGIVVEKSELVPSGGMNEHLYNALYEGGPRNGVLTAVEDFLETHGHEWSFELKPEHFGLGILRRRCSER
jgi:predicted O-methyltransferase YrrM